MFDAEYQGNDDSARRGRSAKQAEAGLHKHVRFGTGRMSSEVAPSTPGANLSDHNTSKFWILHIKTFLVRHQSSQPVNPTSATHRRLTPVTSETGRRRFYTLKYTAHNGSRSGGDIGNALAGTLTGTTWLVVSPR
jgi:hypothetical protein